MTRTRSRRAADQSLAEVLDRALRDQNRSLTWVHDRLAARGSRVSTSSLSAWRTGQRQPEHAASLDALDEIDDLLRLPTGTLRSALGPSRRGGVLDEATAAGDLLRDGPTDALATALQALDADDALERFADEAASFTCVFDADRHLARYQARLRIRAVLEPFERFPMWFFLSRPIPRAIDIAALHGGTVGRRIDDLASGLLAHDVVLDRPLRVGETTIVEAILDIPDPGGERETEFVVYPHRRVNEVETCVRFHPDALPGTCSLTTGLVGEPVATASVDVSGLRQVHHSARGFGPGSMGIHWSWPEFG